MLGGVEVVRKRPRMCLAGECLELWVPLFWVDRLLDLDSGTWTGEGTLKNRTKWTEVVETGRPMRISFGTLL